MKVLEVVQLSDSKTGKDHSQNINDLFKLSSYLSGLFEPKGNVTLLGREGVGGISSVIRYVPCVFSFFGKRASQMT